MAASGTAPMLPICADVAGVKSLPQAPQKALPCVRANPPVTPAGSCCESNKNNQKNNNNNKKKPTQTSAALTGGAG